MKSKLAKIFKWKNILIGVSFLFFVICVLEGAVFYKNVSESIFARAMLNIQNAIQAFFMSTEINTEDVVETLDTQLTAYQRVLAYLYLATVVLAPFCTAAAVVSLAKSAWYRILTALKAFHKKQRIIICGYDSGTEQLISSIQKDSALPVILFTREEMSKEQRMKLGKKGVRVVEFSDYSEAQNLCRQYRAERAAYVILMHRKTTDNFSSFLELDKYVRSCLSGKTSSIPCYLFADNSIREVIDAYYDNREAEAGEGKLHLDLHILQLRELQAREVFQAKPVYTWNLESGKCNPEQYCHYQENAENPWNVHMLVAGFGELGQSVLLEAVTQSVMHPRSRIIIDVVDKQMKEQFLRFCKRFSSHIRESIEQNVLVDGLEVMYRIRLGEGSVLGGGSLDGLLELRFYHADIYHETFDHIVENVSSGSPLTYCAVCFSDAMRNITAATSLEKILRMMNNLNAPVVLASDRKERIMEYLQENDKQFKSIFVMAEERNFLTIDRIRTDEEERQAKEFNYKYNLLSQNMKLDSNAVKAVFDEEEMEKQWRKMPIFKRNSSRAMSSHGNVKKMLLSNTPNLSWKEVEEVFRIEDDQANVEYINANEMIKNFSMLEHRRWCYFMILNGYAYVDGVKNDMRKENPCILSWKELCEKKPEYCRYDIAAFLPEMR